MATQEEYKERLLPLIDEEFSPQMSRAALAHEAVPTRSQAEKKEDVPDFSLTEEEKLVLAEQLAAILAELERQNQAASQIMNTMTADNAEKKAADDDQMAAIEAVDVPPPLGYSKKGTLLHYLHNPTKELQAEIDQQPELGALWAAAQKAAAPSQLDSALFAPSSAHEAAFSREASGSTAPFSGKWGDIYGRGKYEIFDTGWANALKNSLLNLLPKRLGSKYGVADFVRRDAWQGRIRLQSGSDGAIRIAIIGDWGAGKYRLDGLDNPDGPACAVMETLAKLPNPPDCLIHLGDTYYAGTGSNRSPKNEEANNFLEMLKLYPKVARPGKCFALNSNHEMYGGAYGYYAALNDPLFSRQQGCSYFALEFGGWIIAGIDSAYFTSSGLHTDGGLGRAGQDPQRDFLQQLHTAKAAGKKIILMSHHTGLSPDGVERKQIWKDVTALVAPDYWYWGHLHLGVVYKNSVSPLDISCRCVGHSSMPFAIPSGMRSCGNTVAWYSQTPLAQGSERAKNGFALLTLGQNSIREEFYEFGNTVPVWHN